MRVQQTVADADTAKHLIMQHGWLYAGTLPNGKVVLKRPGNDPGPDAGAGPKGFDPLTIGLEVQHSIHAELWAQRTFMPVWL